MRLLARLLILLSALSVLSGCDSAGGPEEVTEADLVGTFRLVSVAPECDYHTGTEVKTGGTFTATAVSGTLRFDAGGTVTHEFDVRGTCAFPDGAAYTLGRAASGTGSYTRTGSSVTLEHEGVTCTGSIQNDSFTVRTGTLISPYRLTYRLEKGA